MVQVRVSEGLLEGEILKGALGKQYWSFKGIPYAAPPIGNLRFKSPQPPKQWDGVRSAKEHGPICHQFDIFTRTIQPGSEDCLYLNVYSPNMKPSTPLPVMVWIHGGGFMSGSGNSDFYGPDFLIEQDVVLVTINYRLEVFGFLCLNTPDIPGNAGMKDQVAALRWVQKNIRNFGGNPDNVTIFGESAGGASVSYHLYSPMSKGLFKRAIMQSGTVNCYWANTFAPRERAIAAARHLGFEGSDEDHELYEFFKSMPTESLAMLQVPILLSESVTSNFGLPFVVVEEKNFGNNERFFYGDIYDNMRQGIHEGVDVMIGYTADEGIITFGSFQKEHIDNLYNKYVECFVPSQVKRNCTITDQLQVGREIKNYYFGKNKLDLNNVKDMLDYHSLNMFTFDITQWVKCHAKQNKKAYFYKFTCYSERNIMTKLFDAFKLVKMNKQVVSHADDLTYLFDVKQANLPLVTNSKSYKMIENVTKLWTNFAKFGNPTPDNTLGVKWQPYTIQHEEYLDIGEKLVAGHAPDKEQISFWELLYDKYAPNMLA